MTDPVGELTRFNVISSRVRLARNVRGLPFPGSGRRADPRLLRAMEGGRRKSGAKGSWTTNFCA